MLESDSVGLMNGNTCIAADPNIDWDESMNPSSISSDWSKELKINKVNESVLDQDQDQDRKRVVKLHSSPRIDSFR